MLARHIKWRDQKADEYRNLVRITRTVLRQGQTVAWRLAARIRRGTDASPIRAQLQRAHAKIRWIYPLLERVVDQTKQRVFSGNTHLSRQGAESVRAAHRSDPQRQDRQTYRVRKMVTIQEAEGGLVTAYAVQPKRVADIEVWEPTLKSHVAIFGRAPCLATADRGVSSHRNEIAAHNAGVRRVCLPAKGRALARKRTI